MPSSLIDGHSPRILSIKSVNFKSIARNHHLSHCDPYADRSDNCAKNRNSECLHLGYPYRPLQEARWSAASSNVDECGNTNSLGWRCIQHIDANLLLVFSRLP